MYKRGRKHYESEFAYSEIKISRQSAAYPCHTQGLRARHVLVLVARNRIFGRPFLQKAQLVKISLYL